MIASHIAYVALVVHEIEGAATVFARHLGLAQHMHSLGVGGANVPAFTVGRSVLVLIPPGDPFVGGETRTGLHHIALACEDFPAAEKVLGDAGIVVRAANARADGLDGRERLAIPPDQTAGVRLHLTQPMSGPDFAPGPIERIDHVGVASADNEHVTEIFCKRLGFSLESQQTDVETRLAVESFTSDKYGVVTHTRRPEIVGGLRVAFITIGDCELEFLHDFIATAGDSGAGNRPGTTKQDQSAIARFIASRGPGLHHLALKVGDIDGTLAKLACAGVRLIDPVWRPGSRHAKIGFIHPTSLGGLLVHLVERDEMPASA